MKNERMLKSSGISYMEDESVH
uniref:Uncharacterized protein n=1 Tax=Magnetococcus massalia (strain MO-1) TaxID=451514 RepID=A0A1S7LDN4_MAGMO|nr:protein of unknown function [Candidatus Magnetococcus massalia]